MTSERPSLGAPGTSERAAPGAPVTSERPRLGAVVTGGAGFIGSRLVAALLKARWSVTVLDDLSTGRLDRLPLDAPDLRFVHGSITDQRDLDEAMRGNDVLFHLAAQVSVPESIADPLRTDRVNVQGWAATLRVADAHGIRAAVFSSSCSVYGDAQELPVSERCPPSPQSPYAASKLTGEEMGYAWATPERGFVALRFFNVYGPDQDVGGAYAAVLAAFVERARGGGSPTMFGDGLQTRDFVYVDDVVAAMILAAERALKGESFGPLNVGTGVAGTLLELWTVISGALGCAAPPLHLPVRVGDIRHSCADVSLLREVLDWVPAISLRDGVARLLDPVPTKG